MTQLLERLDAQIAQSIDDIEIGELRAQKAAYLARIGDFDAARNTISVVRSVFGDGRSGRVTCQVMIAEALLARYESFGRESLDRLNRALFLSQAGRQQDLIAASAVWKAYIEFDFGLYAGMRRSLDIATTTTDDRDDAVHARLALIKVLGAQLLGRRVDAQKWFLEAHKRAVAIGDRASIEALVFNRSVYGIARHRIDWVNDCLDKQGLEFSISELQSAQSYWRLARITSLQGHGDLAMARAESLLGRYSEALARFRSLNVESGYQSTQINSAALDVDIAYCLRGLGEVAAAREMLAVRRTEELDGLDADEGLVAIRMWQEITSSPGDLHGQQEISAVLDQWKSLYDAQEREIANAFEGAL